MDNTSARESRAYHREQLLKAAHKKHPGCSDKYALEMHAESLELDALEYKADGDRYGYAQTANDAYECREMLEEMHDLEDTDD